MVTENTHQNIKVSEQFFMFVKETFLREEIFKNDKDDLKVVHDSAHSLKSSNAIFGAMELSSYTEILEEDTQNLLKDSGSFKQISGTIISEIESSIV